MEIRAFVQETQRHRLSVGAKARFIPDDLFRRSIEAHIVEISEAGESAITLPYFQSRFGGDIAVEESSDGTGTMTPVEAIYQVRFFVDEEDATAVDKALRGAIHVEAKAESFGYRAFQQIAKVFLRELGV